MKKLFMKMTKVVLLVAILITQLGPTIKVFADSLVESLVISVKSDVDAEYTKVDNNGAFAFDHELVTTMNKYEVKLGGIGFVDTNYYLVRVGTYFYGVWDLNNRFDSDLQYLFLTGKEINDGYLYDYNYQNYNGITDLVYDVYDLSNISIGGKSLNTFQYADLITINETDLVLALSGVNAIDNYKISLETKGLKNEIIVDNIYYNAGSDINPGPDGVYEINALPGIGIDFSYEMANLDPNGKYYQHLMVDDAIVSNRIVDYNDIALYLHNQQLNFDKVINGEFVIFIKTFNERDELVLSKDIPIRVVNSTYGLNNGTYDDYFNLTGASLDNMLEKLMNYLILDDAEKEKLTNKEELDMYSLKYNNIFNDNVLKIILDESKSVSSFNLVNGELNNFIVLDKKGVVETGDVSPTVEDILEKIENRIPLAEKKFFKAIIKNRDGSVAPNDEVISTGMMLEFKYAGVSNSYKFVVSGNVVSNNAAITDDDAINALDLAIGVSELGNDAYVAANIIDNDEEALVNVLDVSALLYGIRKNDNIWPDYINTMSSNLNVAIDTNDTDVRVGDEIEVNLLLNGFNSTKINGLEGIFDYDKSLLECVSVEINSDLDWFGNINVNNGKFMYAGHTDIAADIVMAKVIFKAIGIGSSEIKVDKILMANDFDLVTAINESSNIIEINIDRALSTNNKIKSFTHSVGNLNKAFNMNDTDYILYVNYYVNSITLGGELDDEYSSTVGFKTYNLPHYSNDINIVVTAENGDVRTYKITVIKVDNRSDNNNLKSLEVGDYDIAFDKNKLEYKISVENDVKSLEITALAENENATVEITGNHNFKVGKNLVTITVTSQKGNKKEYVLEVDRNEEENVPPKDDNDDKENSNSKILLIVLIGAVVAGLIYLIIKDDKSDGLSKKKKN